ncbi:hypothetical protein HK104_001869 [Borealophlyctis nickersoniae]|nr:hypothetical protein HK104_001869 [Borealophlyctis nickersoniae]
MSDKTGNKTQLSPSTPDFAHLEYGLQLSLRSSTARIVAAYALSNPHLTVQFERRCKDMLVLSSWVDASHLTGTNTEEDVIRRGFQFVPPQPGMKIEEMLKSCGEKERKSDTQQRTIRKAMLCRIGVGRAHVADEATAEACAVPEGYDSFYIHDPSKSRDAKQNGENQYYHEYFIKGSNQVLPVYLIHYDYDPVKEKKSRERANCENCEEEPATVYCSADAANLCNKCDTQLHTSKLASRHVRTHIGKGSDVFGHCRHHPDKQIEFFCSTCHIPVCVFCKMVGNHANGEANKHPLVSVAEAYQAVLQEAQMVSEKSTFGFNLMKTAHKDSRKSNTAKHHTQTDPILLQRRTDITTQITALHSRATAVQKMSSTLHAYLTQLFTQAQSDLDAIVTKKLNILLGDELELRRQLEEMDRLDQFVNYQRNGDANLFLFGWSRQQVYRAELRDFRFFRRGIDVGVDAKVTVGFLASFAGLGSEAVLGMIWDQS